MIKFQSQLINSSMNMIQIYFFLPSLFTIELLLLVCEDENTENICYPYLKIALQFVSVATISLILWFATLPIIVLISTM